MNGNVDVASPNPRLQRARAALLRQSVPSGPVLSGGDRRAPLSRQPLGRVILALLFVAGILGCDARPHWQGVNVSGMEEWRGAVVSIDGVAVGKLEYLRTHGSWFEKLLKGSGDSPMFHVVTLNVPFDLQRTPAGVHVVSVAKPGEAPLTCELTYPDPRGVDVASLAITANKLEDVTAVEKRP